jgi:hypothetical protein
VKWTRVLSPEERSDRPERWLAPREDWIPRERLIFVDADYRRVPREVWDPDEEAWRRVL